MATRRCVAMSVRQAENMATPNTGGQQNSLFGPSDSPGLLRRILGNREDSGEGNGPPSMPMPVE
jgi:hypothetical protein